MSNYITTEGHFQSDTHPELPPDKIIFSFKDPEAHGALELYAKTTANHELGEAILKRLKEMK